MLASGNAPMVPDRWFHPFVPPKQGWQTRNRLVMISDANQAAWKPVQHLTFVTNQGSVTAESPQAFARLSCWRTGNLSDR